MITTLKDFVERYGDGYPPIPINDGHTVLLHSGAEYSGIDPRLMMFAEPPAEPKAKLRAQRRYFKSAIDFEVRAFNRFQSECSWQDAMAQRYVNMPSSGPQATEQLRAGQARIQKLRDELTAVEAELGEPDQPSSSQQVIEQLQSRNESIRAEAEERAAITV